MPPVTVGQFLSRPRWCSLGFPYSAPGPRWGLPPPDLLVCPPLSKFLAAPLYVVSWLRVELQISVMCGRSCGRHCKKFPRETVRAMQRADRLNRKRQQLTWFRMRLKDQLRAKETVTRDPTDANFIKPLESIRTRRQNPENPGSGNHPHQVEPGLGDSDNLHSVAWDSYPGLGHSSYYHNPNASSNHCSSDDAVSIKVEPGLEDSGERFADFSVPVLAANVKPSQSTPSSCRADTVGVKVGGGFESEFCVPVYNNCVKSDPGGDKVSQCDGPSSSSSSAAAAAGPTDVSYSLRTRQVYRPVDKQIRRRRRRLI